MIKVLLFQIVWVFVVSFPHEYLPSIEVFVVSLLSLSMLANLLPVHRLEAWAKTFCQGEQGEWIPNFHLSLSLSLFAADHEIMK